MKILTISVLFSILSGSYLTSEVAYADRRVNNCPRSIGSACGDYNTIRNNNRIIYPKESTGSWELNKRYNAGDKVVYQGKLYKCIQSHTAYASDWTPPQTPALWERI